MAFKNEYVPPIEQEKLEFFRKAREILRTGCSKYDRWTVDREREMVLFRRGKGHSMEDQNEEYWSFFAKEGEFEIKTEILARSEISSEEIAITRSISLHSDPTRRPDDSTLACIKEALREYGRWDLFNPEAFRHCELTLIDAKTGKEI